MSRGRVIQNAFTSGELSPRLMGRTDLDAYAHGAQTLRNAIVFKQGGVTWRSGTRFIRESKDSTAAVILLPVAPTSPNYIAELGDNYVRIIDRMNGSVVHDIASGYSSADLSSLAYAVTRDRVYIVHPDYAPKILILSSATWFLSDVAFTRGPFFTQNASATWTLTPSATTGTGITITASVSTFSAGHVGSLWKLSDGSTTGYFKITAFGTATSVTADVVETLPAGANYKWSEGVFSTAKGFPSAVTTHQGRLVLGNTSTLPDYIWGSQTLDYDNFDAGSALDNEAYTFRVSGAKKIRWLSGGRSLVVGAIDSVLALDGGTDSVIAPSNPPVSRRTAFGASAVAPVSVHNGIMFVQRSGKVLREHVLDVNGDSYEAADITALADHILGDGAVQLDYQQGPRSTVWAVLSDGTMAGMTYEKGNNVVAWHRHDTDGLIESVVSVTGDDGTDETLWLVVNRTIGGTTKRFIEYMDDAGGYYGPLMVDSGVVYAAGAALNGLSHLEGKEVDILVAGVYYPRQTVTSGAVTRPAAGVAEVGLPFSGTIVPVRPDMRTGTGTGQGVRQRFSKVWVRVYQSAGFTINGNLVTIRQGDAGFGTTSPLITGDRDVLNSGWAVGADITIERSQPLPGTFLAVIGLLNQED